MSTPSRLPRVAAVLRLDAQPWRHWLVVYAVLLLYFLSYRSGGLNTMLRLFATPAETTLRNRLAAVVLGSCEDLLLATLLLVLLSLVDGALGPLATTQRVWLRRVARAACHVLLVTLAIVPFAADVVLIDSQELRFTFEFIVTYLREYEFAAGVEVEPRDVRTAMVTVAIAVVTVAFLVATTMLWLDLSRWHLGRLVQCTPKVAKDDDTQLSKAERGERLSHSMNGAAASPMAAYSPREQSTGAPYEQMVEQMASGDETPRVATAKKAKRRHRLLRNVGVPVALLVGLSVILLLVTHSVPPVVAAIALNSSLNELFRVVLKIQFIASLGDGQIGSAADYLDSKTESYELFKDDVLYRKTTGFKGDLAFDVAVNQSDLPNVLVITVESFRYQDSQYIVGNKSSALLERQHNLTLTPNFDRWAKRGVTFRNFWSSWQTSRSVESILFAQVPYDHVTDSGTSTGRPKVKLNGMPQFFSKKGYETAFTTGTRLKYDEWTTFFSAHGMDSVVGPTKMREYAEQHFNISEKDWKPPKEGGQGRSFFWGVHDDVSFEYLGDLLLNKTAAQKARVASGEKKQPFFLNHYTISSHTPWRESPKWFDDEPMPDFSALYEGLGDHADDVKRYAKLRYFSDVKLGKFLDRMQTAGLLNDTIVVITGDHGQSPEVSMTREYDDEIATTRVAATLLAEGRLANYSGLILDDASHHYDLFNTLADIVGVPEDGFLQSGVGRSLKRAAPFGERVVWSNNPMHHFSVVKGSERLSYDRLFSRMRVSEPDADPMETTDLYSSLSDDQQTDWHTLRHRGRRLSRYFRVRWDKKCISAVDC